MKKALTWTSHELHTLHLNSQKSVRVDIHPFTHKYQNDEVHGRTHPFSVLNVTEKYTIFPLT